MLQPTRTSPQSSHPHNDTQVSSNDNNNASQKILPDTYPTPKNNNKNPPNYNSIAHNSSSSSSHNFVVDQGENLAVAVIAFGNATQTRLVERVIRSVRSRGQLKTTPVLIWTDQRGHYEETLKDDPFILVMYPQPSDEAVLNLKDTEFKAPKMKYKRFKTRLIDDILLDPRLTRISRILYLDIDIVVCQPLRPFVDRYWNQFANNNNKNGKKHQQIIKKSASSWMMAFPGGEQEGKTAHSGVLLLGRIPSKGCLDYWRRRMDEGRQKFRRDQEILRLMRRSDNQHHCHVFVFRRSRDEFLFPTTPQDLGNNNHYPIFMHITNTHHVHLLNASVQQAFLEDALLLTEQERNSESSLAKTVATF